MACFIHGKVYISVAYKAIFSRSVIRVSFVFNISYYIIIFYDVTK